MKNIIEIFQYIEGISSRSVTFAKLQEEIEKRDSQFLRVLSLMIDPDLDWHVNPQIPTCTDTDTEEHFQIFNEFISWIETDVLTRKIIGARAKERCEAYISRMGGFTSKWAWRVIQKKPGFGLGKEPTEEIVSVLRRALGKITVTWNDVEYDENIHIKPLLIYEIPKGSSRALLLNDGKVICSDPTCPDEVEKLPGEWKWVSGWWIPNEEKFMWDDCSSENWVFESELDSRCYTSIIAGNLSTVKSTQIINCELEKDDRLFYYVKAPGGSPIIS